MLGGGHTQYIRRVTMSLYEKTPPGRTSKFHCWYPCRLGDRIVTIFKMWWKHIYICVIYQVEFNMIQVIYIYYIYFPHFKPGFIPGWLNFVEQKLPNHLVWGISGTIQLHVKETSKIWRTYLPGRCLDVWNFPEKQIRSFMNKKFWKKNRGLQVAWWEF